MLNLKFKNKMKEVKKSNLEKQQKVFRTFRTFLAGILGIGVRKVNITHDYKNNIPVLTVDGKTLNVPETELVQDTQKLLLSSLQKLS